MLRAHVIADELIGETDRFERARPGEHADLLSRKGEANTQQTANGPRTYDAHAHARTLLMNH